MDTGALLFAIQCQQVAD